MNRGFAPETLIFTSEGVQEIQTLGETSRVLGRSGEYRQVREIHRHEQHPAIPFPDEGFPMTFAFLLSARLRSAWDAAH